MAEYDSAGNLLRRYVHGPGSDEPMVQYEGPTVSAASRRYLHADHQGSIVATSSSDGTRLDLNTYDAYGVPGETNAGRFAYTGQIALPELGLYHYKARAYDPRLGRFLQTDPVGYSDQFNLYAYVGNDPVNLNDSSGLFTGLVVFEGATNGNDVARRQKESKSCSGPDCADANSNGDDRANDKGSMIPMSPRSDVAQQSKNFGLSISTGPVPTAELFFLFGGISFSKGVVAGSNGEVCSVTVTCGQLGLGVLAAVGLEFPIALTRRSLQDLGGFSGGLTGGIGVGEVGLVDLSVSRNSISTGSLGAAIGAGGFVGGQVCHTNVTCIQVIGNGK